MVILDSTTLFFLFEPNAKAPIDPASGLPVTDCKERIETLIGKLSENRIRILVPTPVLSEILVAAGPKRLQILQDLNKSSRFKIEPFEQTAAVEVACLTDGDAKWSRGTTDLTQTKAKIKYDRQIIAIAKVNGVETIYSDDIGLAKCAKRNGISVIRTSELPLADKPGQFELPLADTLDASEPLSPPPDVTQADSGAAPSSLPGEHAQSSPDSGPKTLVSADSAGLADMASPEGTSLQGPPKGNEELSPSTEAPVVRLPESAKSKTIGPLH